MRSPNKSDSAPLLDDQPSAVDLLNFGQFAAALCDIILRLPGNSSKLIIFGVVGEEVRA